MVSPAIRPRRRPAPYAVVPLTMTWTEAAAELRVTESWLRDHIGALPGFPRPHPLLDVFATEAVEAWVRRSFGLVGPATTQQDAEAILLERANGFGARAIPG